MKTKEFCMSIDLSESFRQGLPYFCDRFRSRQDDFQVCEQDSVEESRFDEESFHKLVQCYKEESVFHTIGFPEPNNCLEEGGTISSQALLEYSRTAVCRIDQIASMIPALQGFSIEKNLLTDLPALVFFLNTAVHYSLCRVLGGVIGLPEGISLEDGARKIRQWILSFPRRNITALCCEDVPLPCFPRELCALEELQEITFRNCSLMSIPPDIGKLTQLRALDVSENGLTCIPNEIAGCFVLEVVNLSNNFIENIPLSIGSLMHLRELNVNFNDLQELPQTFGELKTLESLFLYGNNLTFLPPQIGDLAALKHLNVSKNLLRMAPDSFSRLTNLAYLSFDDNLLQVLPSSICSLLCLELLCLRGNCLQTLPEDLANVRGLRLVDLQNNPLTADGLMQIQQLPCRVIY
jgi:Leucine-rich repeat (LRR) protein